MKKLFTILAILFAVVAVNAQMTITDDFESYTDFEINPTSQWTFVDVDADSTYGFNGITFLNAYSPMAFIVFNPSACSPAITTYAAHSGSKFMASFACSTTNPNNDWMISPALDGNAGNITFYARALTNTYGLEKFNVAYSTTTNTVDAFTNLNPSVVSVDTTWTEFSYDFPAGTQYVAIQYVAQDVFALFVDDVTIQTTIGINENTQSNLRIFPNPCTNMLNVSAENYNKVELINLLGQVVYTNSINNFAEINVSNLNNGVYFVRLSGENGTTTQRFIKK